MTQPLITCLLRPEDQQVYINLEHQPGDIWT